MKQMWQSPRRRIAIASLLAAAGVLCAVVGRSRRALGAGRVPPPAPAPTSRALRALAPTARRGRARKKRGNKKVVSMSSLGVSQFVDPRSVVAKAPSPGEGGPGAPVRATIYLVQNFKEAISLFRTDVLTRYGTGRLAYDVVEASGTCDASCTPSTLPEPEPGPCLAVSRYFKKFSCAPGRLQCNYPRCQTFVSNDEWCNAKTAKFDFRQYHSTRFNSTSLPLGPRIDTWKSFRKLWAQDPPPPRRRASERKYAFNAIFSQNTHKARRGLAKLVTTGKAKTKLEVYAKMAKAWAKSANSFRTKQVRTNTVVKVMSDSVFTLTPRGHHPECFRLFEAAEAGSIPVLTAGDFAGSKCLDPLAHWRDAPVVLLRSWKELWPTVEGLMRDPARLDAMQRDFAAWYEAYMRRSVARLEDALLASWMPASGTPETGGAVEAGAFLPATPLEPMS